MCWIVLLPTTQIEKNELSKQITVGALCFGERRADLRMPQRTLGFKIFKTFFTFQTEPEQQRGAEIGNSPTELAGSVA